MEVTYKTTVVSDKDWYERPRTRYKFNAVKVGCCVDMTGAWNEEFVVLQDESVGDLLPEVQLRFAKSDYEGGLVHDYEGIDFCPWCGEKITMKEVERVRLVSKLVQTTQIKTVTEYEEIPEEVRKQEDWEKK